MKMGICISKFIVANVNGGRASRVLQGITFDKHHSEKAGL